MQGLIVTALNLIGAALIQIYIKRIKFWSKQKQIMVTILSIFLLTYTLTDVIPVWKLDRHKKFLPTGLTRSWFQLYNKTLFTSTFTTNFIPYLIGPLKDILLYKCCKKKFNRGDPARKLKLEQKYGLMLNTSFTVISFCFEMPLLLTAAAISFCFQYVLDRLLITYWYDEYPIHSDSLDAFVLRVFKYAPSIMMIFSGMIVY
jgi:hypothetical protein